MRGGSIESVQLVLRDSALGKVSEGTGRYTVRQQTRR